LFVTPFLQPISATAATCKPQRARCPRSEALVSVSLRLHLRLTMATLQRVWAQSESGT